MALGIPIAYALRASGVALMWHLGLFDAQILAQNFINGADSLPLLAAPFFMLASESTNVRGLSRRIVDFALALVGHVKGGLGYVVILAACLLSALVGSAAADAAAQSALLLPMMIQAGLKKELSGGLIAASGVTSPIIPPSIVFVIFGVAVNVSITKLFIAGIFPGIMIGHGLALAWWWVARGGGDTGTAPTQDECRSLGLGTRVAAGDAAAVAHPGGASHGRVHPQRSGRAPEYLRTNKQVLTIVQYFSRADKPIAAVCHVAQLLSAPGVIRRKRVSAHPARLPQFLVVLSTKIECCSRFRSDSEWA